MGQIKRMARLERLTELHAGMPLLMGGNQVLRVPSEVAERFKPGDSVVGIAETGEVLLIPAEAQRLVAEAVGRASSAFQRMSGVSDAQSVAFYGDFAARLATDSVWAEIAEENRLDIEGATERGRSTTRLVASEKLRQNMIAGLEAWTASNSPRGKVVQAVQHDGWVTELLGAGLGVVAFVFEGRPNVLADATGVLRGGNTVVFRIGRDALRTARAMMRLALEPALAGAGLPAGACVLVDSPDHAAGWALFMDRRVALAVARGSGQAVVTLGRLAESAGIPVSQHGTGGAWLFGAESASAPEFESAVFSSLDRKVCNTLNTCCIVRSAAERLVPALLSGLERAGERLGHGYKLHVVEGDQALFPEALFKREVLVRRAEGDSRERQAELIVESELGREWEWEQTPEMGVHIVESLEQGVELFNRVSPRFVACLVSDDQGEHGRFYETVDAPFVGDGYTRWVDGQLALNRPELGLSNWERGRLFGRGGILSGDSVFTLRTRVRRVAS